MAEKLKKFGSLLKSLITIPRAKVRKDKVILYFSLTLIFFFALLIRIYSYFSYGVVLKAFDPWFQLKSTLYIISHGFSSWFNWVEKPPDISTWYPIGRNMPKTSFPGIPWTAATLYFILRFLGVEIDPITLCYFFPAIMGALASIAMYFFGKELSGSAKAGLLSAFFLAFVPGYVQRTTAGFFDNEALGILLIILSLYFFVRSLKRESILSGIMGGLFLGYLSATWGAYIYVFDLLAVYALLLLILRRYSKSLLLSYTTTVGLGLFIATRIPRLGPVILTRTDVLPPLAMLVILSAYEGAPLVYNSLIVKRIMKIKMGKKVLGYALLLAIIVISSIFVYLWYIGLSPLIILEKYFKPIGGKFLTVLNPLYREKTRIIASVAEHAATSWAEFYFNLNVLLFVYPLGIYFSFKRLKNEDIFLITLGLTATYFAGSMIRLILILSPAVCLLSAYAIDQILSPFVDVLKEVREGMPLARRKRARISGIVGTEYTIVTLIFVASLLIIATWYGAWISSKYMAAAEMLPNGEPDWQEALVWMKYNLPENAVIASWWDYGYWINTVANKTTIVDNATLNSTQIAWIGAAFALNETEAVKIYKRYNVTHVLVFFGYCIQGLGGDEFKWPWMVRIAEDHFPELVNESLYGDITNPTDTFFNSTIYKLLFYREPDPEPNKYRDSLINFMIRFRYLAYYRDPYGQIPDVDPQHWALFEKIFKPIYLSSNRFVKIFEVNYSILEARMEISDANLYNNGLCIVTINNTGIHSFQLSKVYVNGEHYDFEIVKGSETITPNKTVEIVIDTEKEWSIGDNATIKVVAIVKEYPGYKISTSMNITVTEAPKILLVIDEEATTIYDNGVGFVKVKNIGEFPVTVDSIVVNTTETLFTVVNGSLTILPQNKTLFVVDLGFNETTKLTSPITTVNVTYHPTGAPKELMYTVINATVTATPPLLLNIENATAYTNGIVTITVSNPTNLSIKISGVTINGTNYSFEIINGTSTLNKDEIAVLKVSTGVYFNVTSTVNITVYYHFTYASRWANETSITNVTVKPYANMSAEAYSNGNITVVITNLGIERLEVSTLIINGTIYNFEVINGSTILDPGDSVTLMLNYTEAANKTLKAGNKLDIKVEFVEGYILEIEIEVKDL